MGCHQRMDQTINRWLLLFLIASFGNLHADTGPPEVSIFSPSDAYDLAGNLTNKVDFNGRSTAYSYDSMDRLLSKTPDQFFVTPPVVFTYTPNGQRSGMSDSSGTTTYFYNSRDWLTNKVWQVGAGISSASVTLSLNYTHDPYGNVTRIYSETAGGTDTRYGYDALNRLAGATDTRTGETTYSYDAVGNLQGYQYPNGVTHGYSYDSLNRLTNLASGLLGNLRANYRYTVLPSGHRQTADETVAATSGVQTINRLYSYDATYRLTDENLAAAGPVLLPSSASVGYTLDDVGNRLGRNSTLPGVESASSSYDPNDRLTTDTYDANGNTVVGRVTTSAPLVNDVYDFEDRLINRNNGQIVVHYDGDGNRVAKTVSGVTTFYLVDDRNPTGYAQVLEELASSTGTKPALFRTYSYGHDLVSQNQILDDGQGGLVWNVTFYGYDGHGNVRYLSDSTGTVTDTYDYDAFGTLIAQSGSTPNAYIYCGEQFDEDLGLYYNRARYLNADSGRFWSSDSYEGNQTDPLSLHQYLYIHSDPVNGLDPSGHWKLDDLMVAMGAKNYLQATRIILSDKARTKSVQTLGCVVGIESLKKYMDYEFSGKTQKHHPIPIGMGGPDKNLLLLPSESHRLFHFTLHILLRNSKQFGGLHNYSTALDWAEQLSTKAGKKALLTVIKQAGAYVDKQCKYPKSMGLVNYIKKNEKEWLKQ